MNTAMQSVNVRALPASEPSPLGALLAVVSRVAFALWIPAVLIPCAYLLASHLLTLPHPTVQDPVLVAAVAAARGPAGVGRLVVLHVLFAECNCSRRVLRHLLQREPRADAVERIVLVGHDDAAATDGRARGYSVVEVTAERLAADYHVESAPMMVVADAAGVIRYLGGYTDRKQGATVRDDDVLGRLAAGEQVAPLPLFGCAVSRQMRGRVDPLGIR